MLNQAATSVKQEEGRVTADVTTSGGKKTNTPDSRHHTYIHMYVCICNIFIINDIQLVATLLHCFVGWQLYYASTHS